MNIPDSIHEVVAKAPLAHLTRLNNDGAPQVTVVWVGIECIGLGGQLRKVGRPFCAITLPVSRRLSYSWCEPSPSSCSMVW
jgi:hypothetical protein